MEASTCDEMELGIHMEIENDVVENQDDIINDEKYRIEKDNKLDTKEVIGDENLKKGSTTSTKDKEDAYNEEEDVYIMEKLHYYYKENRKLKKKNTNQRMIIQDLYESKKESSKVIETLKEKLMDVRQF